MIAKFITVRELLEAAKLPPAVCYTAPYADLKDEVSYRHEVSGIVKTGAEWKAGYATMEAHNRKHGGKIICPGEGGVYEVGSSLKVGEHQS